MQQPLFPVYNSNGDQSTPATQNNANSAFAWLKIGAKKPSADTNLQAPQQTTLNQNKPTLVEQKNAAPNQLEKNITEIVSKKPLHSADDDEDKQARKARKKEKKKKNKDKGKKDKEKIELDFKLKNEADDMMALFDKDIEVDNDIPAELELYVDPNQHKIDKETTLLYRHFLKKGLCEISLIRFGERENYTYGAPQIKDVGLFRRLRHNLILGLKSDKNTSEIIDELNKIQGINKSISVKPDTSYPRHRYHNTALPEDQEIIELAKEPANKPELDEERDFVPLEDEAQQNDKMEAEKVSEEFKMDKSEMSFREMKLMETNKKYSKLIEDQPTDITVWVDYCKIQDSLFQIANSKHSHSVAEKKLSILEKALTNKEIEKDPFLLIFYIKVLDSSNRNDDFYKVLHKTWMDSLEKIPLNFYAWKLFLDFKFTNFTKYSVSYLRTSLTELHELLSKKIDQSKTTNEISNYREISLSLLKRRCFLEKLAGYYERAIGLIQSIIELNVFFPKDQIRRFDFKARTEKFKEFYETYDTCKTGDLLELNGWEDYCKNPAAHAEEFKKNFIGLFEREVEEKMKNTDAIESEGIEEWLRKEYRSLETWRPANNAFDKQRINENADSIVLYEDIENNLLIINQQEQILELIDHFASLLNLPRVFSTDALQLQDSFTHFYYNEILKVMLEELYLKKDDSEWKQTSYHHLGNLLQNELVLKFPRFDEIILVAKRNPTFISKLEYFRRFLYHLQKKYPDSREILLYLMYIEQLYASDSLWEEFSATKGAAKRVRNILKQSQLNYYLWIFYADSQFLKNQSVDEFEKIYVNLMKFATKPKEKMLVLCFYMNHYIKHSESVGIEKTQQTVYDTLQKAVLLLDGKKAEDYVSQQITPISIIKLTKSLQNHLDNAIMKKSKKKPQNSLQYSLLKRSFLALAFYSAALVQFSEQDEVSSKTLQEKLNILEHKLENEHKEIEEVIPANLFRKSYESQLQLLNFMIWKQFYFKGHRQRNFTPPLKDFICQAYRKFPQNALFLSEAINILNKFTHRTNRFLKLKEDLGIRVFRPIIWVFVIFDEIRNFSGSDLGSLVNILHSYFKEFVRIDNPYDYDLDKLEQIYKKKQAKIIDWQNKRVLSEDFLAELMTLGTFYSDFTRKFLPAKLKKNTLILLHKIPYAKERYLEYLQAYIDEEETKSKAFKMLLEKEIRIYDEQKFDSFFG